MIHSVHLLTVPPNVDDHAGFWPGAGVAAAFARAVESGRLNLPRPGGGRTRRRGMAASDTLDVEFALAHLGAVDIALHTARAALREAAAEIDADPDDRQNGGRRRALQVRALVEATATEVMHRVGRALGPAR